ncbi:hypothetical protein V8C86DRAFT_2641220 [Haematococcus lacustris]
MTRNTRKRKAPGDEQLMATSPNATPKYPRLEGAAAAHQRAQSADCEAGLPDIVAELQRQLQDKEQEVRRLQADKQALAAELREANAHQANEAHLSSAQPSSYHDYCGLLDCDLSKVESLVNVCAKIVTSPCFEPAEAVWRRQIQELAQARISPLNKVSSWDQDSKQLALKSYVLEKAQEVMQDLQWPQKPQLVASLHGWPEANQQGVPAATQQLHEATCRALRRTSQFATPLCEAGQLFVHHNRLVRARLCEKLGLGQVKGGDVPIEGVLLAMAGYMLNAHLLMSSLHSSCPGLQLVSRLEDWQTPEGQLLCKEPHITVKGHVSVSRPLCLLHWGLVYSAPGGERKVLRKQDVVALVPDQEWLEQQCVEAEQQLAGASQQATEAEQKLRRAQQRKAEAEKAWKPAT